MLLYLIRKKSASISARFRKNRPSNRHAAKPPRRKTNTPQNQHAAKPTRRKNGSPLKYSASKNVKFAVHFFFRDLNKPNKEQSTN